MEVDFADDRATNPRLTVSGEGDVLEQVALPDEVISTEKPDGGDVWLAAEGGAVIVGDGHGRAWQATFDGETWSEVTPLQGDIRHAAFLRPPMGVAVATGPPLEETPEPTYAPPPPPPPSPDETAATIVELGLTAEASATRDAIVAAAEERDWDALRGLMTEGFSSNFTLLQRDRHARPRRLGRGHDDWSPLGAPHGLLDVGAGHLAAHGRAPDRVRDRATEDQSSGDQRPDEAHAVSWPGGPGTAPRRAAVPAPPGRRSRS